MSVGDNLIHGNVRLYLYVAVCLLSISVAEVSSNEAGLFQGNFTGIAIGDEKTSAPLTLNLTQNGSRVSGSATILAGIKVNTGGLVCPGTVDVPSGTMGIAGSISNRNPRQLVAKSALNASGMKIAADMLADISREGDIMTAQIKLNLPWPCRSPTVKANLARSKS